MVDVHDQATRSRNMAAIRGKNTKPEIKLRQELFKRGFRFRLHRKDLPGKPDIVLPRYNAVILVQGCFWHGHEGCPMFRLPSSRTEFWSDKIDSNKARDEENIRKLIDHGWRVAQVWECSMKGKRRLETDILMGKVVGWLKSNDNLSFIEGYLET